jgi:hypothetical protein
MRGSTFVILAAIIIIGLLTYFYLLPKFKPGETQGGDKETTGIFQQRQKALEAETDE